MPTRSMLRSPCSTASQRRVANAGQAEFNWTDRLGLAAAGPWRLALQSRKDNAPVAGIAGNWSTDVGMLETEVLQHQGGSRAG